MVKVGIVGGTGYVGIELIRLLINHPKIKLEAISSVSYEGQSIQDIYPNILNIVDLKCTNSDEVIERCDVIFTALPHGLSEYIVQECIKSNKVCIDIGADFRLKSEKVYKEWYKKDFEVKEIHKYAVYGLPEIYKEDIKKASIIANPGCYPTGSALGLVPLFQKGMVKEGSVIIDAKSGTTGTGREPSRVTHFSECNENIIAYGIATHRHMPEIEQTLADISGKDVNILFTPHLIPVNRGILSTIYLQLNDEININQIHDLYKEYYKDEKFVRILALGQSANIRNVKHSNFCDISVHMDPRSKRLIIISAIDNMIKGAAGQAIQNMNIRMGFKEEEGLMFVPPAF